MQSITLSKCADFTIQLNSRLFRASSEILCAKCEYFENYSQTSDIKGKTLKIDTEFVEETIILLKWLHSPNNKELLRSLNRLQVVLQIYAVSKKLKVKKHTNFRNILLGIEIENIFFINNRNFSNALCKELIDINFVLRLLNNSKIPQHSLNYIKAYLILEWLGEKNCHNDPEIALMRSSPEFSSILSIFKRERITLSTFEIINLDSLYPHSAQ